MRGIFLGLYVRLPGLKMESLGVIMFWRGPLTGLGCNLVLFHLNESSNQYFTLLST